MKRAFLVVCAGSGLLIVGAILLLILDGGPANRIADVLIIVSCLATITVLIGLSFYRSRDR